jgi:hypothetical protein
MRFFVYVMECSTEFIFWRSGGRGGKAVWRGGVVVAQEGS